MGLQEAFDNIEMSADDEEPQKTQVDFSKDAKKAPHQSAFTRN
jgi:hypothetical protein